MDKTPIHVRFSDIDMAGNVHNSKYLSYFEQARIDFLTKISGENWDWRKKGLLIGRIEVDYITCNTIVCNDLITTTIFLSSSDPDKSSI